MTKTPEFQRDALARFANPGSSTEVRREALSTLLASKQFQSLVGSPDVQAGLDHWDKLARGGQPLERLLAVAELIRISQSAPTLSSRVEEALGAALRLELPELSLLSDADMRLNVARALRRSKEPWVLAYSAAAAAGEEKGDKARQELVSGLLERCGELSAAIRCAAESLAGVIGMSGIEPKAAMRRATKLLEAIRLGYQAGRLPLGQEFGGALDDLLRAAISQPSKLKDSDAAEELAAQGLELLLTVIRSRFAAAAAPESYRSLKRLAALFSAARWPRRLEPLAAELLDEVKEAVLLLGRQGVPSMALLDQTQLLAGGRQGARAATLEWVSQYADLPEEIKYFLTNWRVAPDRRGSSSSIDEAVLQGIDETIGAALIAVPDPGDFEARMSAIREIVDVFDPDNSAQARAEISRAVYLRKVVAELATRRKLVLIGNPGETMVLSSKYFVSRSGKTESEVITPAVARMRSDGTAGACIVKGEMK